MVAAVARVGRHLSGLGMKATGALVGITRRVHAQLIATDQQLDPLDLGAIRARVRIDAPLLEEAEVSEVARQVSRQLFALGPLESVLGDPTVSEVMVNGPGLVWVERDGVLSSTDVEVDSPMLRLIVERIVGPLGLRVDRTSPFADARLADGSRVHIAVPPLALDGPYITIRRFRSRPHELHEFCGRDVQKLLVEAIERRDNIVVSGATGSGKTSLLNALAVHVPVGERVITIEDAAELRLPGEHVVRLEARPPNAEGVGGVSIRSLVRNALRMRPDRLVVGEVRGAEALDMVQAMNTGHDGSMSTCHANSPVDMLHRLGSMVLMGGLNLPIQVVQQHLASALDLVIHVARGDRGERQVRSVYACSGDGAWLVRAGRLVQDATR